MVHRILGHFSLAAFVAGIYISGYYPARALLRKKPIVLLKGKFQNSRAGENTRKILVIVQYTASMILLCGTLIVLHNSITCVASLWG